MGVNLCVYRRARAAYLALSPRDRVGMTPERLFEILRQEGTL